MGQRPAGLLRAWIVYMLLFEAASVPLRALAAWLAARLAADAGGPTRALDLGAQAAAGALLLPISFLCFRAVVARLLARG